MVYRQSERSERVRAVSRGKFLRAARRLFVRRGDEATTMREIAAAARSSIGNLYFYFANKAELLETLMNEAREEVWAQTQAVRESIPAGPARLAVILYANAIALLHRDRDLTHILFREDARPEVADRIAAGYQARMHASLQENLPEYPESQLDLAASAWIGAGRYCVERWVAGQLSGEPLEVAEFVVRWNLRGMGVPEAEIDLAVEQSRDALSRAGSLEPADQVPPRRARRARAS